MNGDSAFCVFTPARFRGAYESSYHACGYSSHVLSGGMNMLLVLSKQG